MKKQFLIALFAMTAMISTMAVAAGNDPMVGGAPMSATKNIVQNASMANNLTTLVAAVKAAGLVDTLETPGPFTVFAPTNEAFDKLPAGTVQTLLKPENKDQLTKVLTYHVVSGKVNAADLMKQIKDSGGKAEPEDGRRRDADCFHAGQAHRSDRCQGRHGDGHHRQRLPVERRRPRHRQRTVAELIRGKPLMSGAPLSGAPFFIVCWMAKTSRPRWLKRAD